MLKRFDRGALFAPRSRLRAHGPWWRVATRYGIAIIAVVVLIGLSANRHAAVPRATVSPFAALFSERASASSRGDSLAPHRMLAVIVAQQRDCNGNLGFASILDRADIAAAVPDRVVLVDGTAQDTTQLRARLPHALAQARIALLQHSQRQALLAFGHRATPVLLLFDGQARLRLSATVSPDPVEVVSLRRAIKHLAANDPLP